MQEGHLGLLKPGLQRPVSSQIANRQASQGASASSNTARSEGTGGLATALKLDMNKNYGLQLPTNFLLH